MNTTPSSLLSNFLLGSELVDSFSFSEFKAFFSSKYSTPDCEEEIRKIYTQYNQRRTAARAAVKRSIKHKTRNLTRYLERSRRPESNPVYSHSLKECTLFLGNTVKVMRQELKELNDQIEACRQELNQFSEDIATVDVDHSSSSTEKTKQLQKLVDQLS